ncbi:NUDIX hydrolase [Acetobacter sp.]|jgi:ADP-ribose pyrophosphatase YjhB (NUDIX family)|uniref:NUDIX hydrolase n=1 Tax=Acetobacter sp. TaxID=440 RepID=UPI0025B94876|nr:NUDIX hydrolase [Acetobacter sp.]MCH4090349.1 NUDIX hydrolase [Acetobacter sp.]MCI1299043.1 NUDIX hydrolase [Acetobacter sp.]MCI1315590.1 NUDIX hydrolase [Acetobacter sp.]
MTSNPPPEPRGAVIAVCRHPLDGRFLLVRRANPPDAELWGFPGGRIEPGEDLLTAASRELAEETGLDTQGVRVLTAFDSIHRHANGSLRFHYVIVAVLCELMNPQETPAPVAADDALEADWFSLDTIQGFGAEASAGVFALARQAEAAVRGP